MRKLLLIFLIPFSSIALFSQSGNKGYNIHVSVKELGESTVYLAYHIGNRQYIRDSVRLGNNGTGLFSGMENLEQGVYLLVLPGSRYFEFLITDDQSFTISCNYNNLINSIEYEGSADNTAFAMFQKGWADLHRRSQGLQSRISANRQANSDSLAFLNELAKALDLEMRFYMKKAISENGSSFVASLIKAMLPVEMPEFRIPPEEKNPDSLKWVMNYNYNKDHYFDNFDLSDERLLRSPVYHNKIEYYFTQIILQYSDSLKKAIDKVTTLAQGNYKTFQYVSVFLFNHFRESQMMGHDALVVKLADEIYLSGKADWVSPEFLQNLRNDVDRIRPSLIGNKGFNLVMDTYEHGIISLDNIKCEFLILYFWEPECGFCKEATPLLHSFYLKNKDKGIEVLSVCTNPDKKAWENYIKENRLSWINGWDPERLTHYDFFYNIQSTPTIFILDRDKKIIAKKLAVENAGPFIESYRLYGR